MCGIVGAFGNKKASDESVLEMANTLKHRGPDDFGIWSDFKKEIFLGHRRLSIIDLSKNGHQPMISSSGRYIIVFNGEIYNHIEIRNNFFSNYRWEGGSDTETLLATFDKWGIEGSLRFLEGMFSFAVWDKNDESLNLVRDRFGEKPLYYYDGDEGIVFASELKAIKSLLGTSLNINNDSLSIFLSLSYIPNPLSIYQNVFKLKPGHIIKFTKSNEKVLKPYWNLEEKYCLQEQNIFQGNDNEAINTLDNLLKKTLENQSISDVPLGSFLSGGIDSSLITAVLQSIKTEPIKTFTIGFNNQEFDESYYAKAISEHLGTSHTEIFLSPEDVLNTIPLLQDIYDEPFADASQIPTFLVSKLAKKNVSVALSGDGADELFAGYNRYIFTERIWNTINKVPLSIRNTSSKILNTIPSPLVEVILNSSNYFLPSKFKFAYPMNKYLKFLDLLNADSKLDAYHRLISFWSFSPPIKNQDDFNIRKYLRNYFETSLESSFIENMMMIDLKYYLTDDVMQKVDRASMANSLETRAPFLDHNIAEFSFSLPLNMKIRNGESKWILKKLLGKYIPRNLFEREKMGFTIPIDNLLRGDLRDWAGDLLSINNLDKFTILDSKSISKIWIEHLKGYRNHQYTLWNILMFLSWHERSMDNI